MRIISFKWEHICSVLCKLLSAIQTLVNNTIIRLLLLQTLSWIMIFSALFERWCLSSSTEAPRQCFQIFFSPQALLDFLNEWETEFIMNSIGTSTNPKYTGLKWQMIGCYCRGLWGLAAQAEEQAPSSLAVASTTSAQHQGCRLHWAHRKASYSINSQHGWALKPQGCQIHTSPRLSGDSVT